MIEPAQRTAAKIAGITYLVAMAAAIFSESYAHGSLVLAGDAVHSAQNILASERLFRVGTVLLLITFASDSLLAAALYVVLKPINRNIALLGAFWRVAESAILGLVTLNDFAALRLLKGGDYLSVFNTGQLQALARFYMTLHGLGSDIGFVFLGLGSTVFAYLWLKSRYIPRALAVLGIFASPLIALGSLAAMLYPDFGDSAGVIYMLPMLVFEVTLGIWLLIRGLRIAIPVDGK